MEITKDFKFTVPKHTYRIQSDIKLKHGDTVEICINGKPIKLDKANIEPII